MIWFLLAWRIAFATPGNKLIPLYVSLHIVAMSAVASALALAGFGGLCVDSLNVASSAAIWGEWIASGPLMFFMTASITDKVKLSRIDWFFIISFFLCLMAGFFIIIAEDHFVGTFWLIISFLAYAPTLYLPWCQDCKKITIYSNDIEKIAILSKRYAIQCNLSASLTSILPFIGITYLVAMWNRISKVETVATFQILSLISKGIFVAASMDAHIDLLLDGNEKALAEERRVRSLRQELMKYIFHELRTPLNSVAVGIDILSSSANLNEQEMECLLTMKTASETIAEHFDNVLTLETLEDGKLTLICAPMSMRICISNVLSNFQRAAQERGLSFAFEASPNVPPRLVGDVRLISQVINGFMSNSIKFSPSGSTIRIRMDCNGIYRRPIPLSDCNDSSSMVNVAVVSVSVQDQGPGISQEKQAKLFGRYEYIRPERMEEGQGAGLGLVLCSGIVGLHRGTIGVKSEVGEGSTFTFTIPFEVSDECEDSVDSANPVCARSSISSGLSIQRQGREHHSREHHSRSWRSYCSVENFSLDEEEPGSVFINAGGSQRVTQSNEVDIKSRIALPASVSLVDNEIRMASRPSTSINAVNSLIAECRSEVRAPSKSFNAAKEFQGICVSEIGGLNDVLHAADQLALSHHRHLGDSFGATSVSLKRQALSLLHLQVLIVDDAESNRKMLQMLLQKKGVENSSASNGDVAVSMVLQDMHRFKLILMDNLMPVLTGREATQRLRANGYPYLIIGVTGNVLADDINEYLAAGADMVLGKPVKMPIFNKVLDHIGKNGPKSIPNMQLVESSSTRSPLVWLPKTVS